MLCYLFFGADLYQFSKFTPQKLCGTLIEEHIHTHKSEISSSEDTPINPRCNLSLDQGSCRNYSIHWYYDNQANSCAQFWYGGCGGNDNRYETEDECKKTCVVRLYRAGDSDFLLLTL